MVTKKNWYEILRLKLPKPKLGSKNLSSLKQPFMQAILT